MSETPLELEDPLGFSINLDLHIYLIEFLQLCCKKSNSLNARMSGHWHQDLAWWQIYYLKRSVQTLLHVVAPYCQI